MMTRPKSTVLLISASLVLACAYLTPRDGKELIGNQDNTAEGQLPECIEDEFLTFTGNQLICQQLPVRRCRCPGEPGGSGDLPLFPLPPEGCPVFEPPARGAFACLRIPDIIYCSVYCSNEFEFSNTPLNPYLCGAPTSFRWIDFTNTTHSRLPRCTGFRHRLLPLHPEEFYLSVPCDELTETQIADILSTFVDILQLFGCSESDCSLDDAFVQCPVTDG